MQYQLDVQLRITSRQPISPPLLSQSARATLPSKHCLPNNHVVEQQRSCIVVLLCKTRFHFLLHPCSGGRCHPLRALSSITCNLEYLRFLDLWTLSPRWSSTLDDLERLTVSFPLLIFQARGVPTKVCWFFRGSCCLVYTLICESLDSGPREIVFI